MIELLTFLFAWLVCVPSLSSFSLFRRFFYRDICGIDIEGKTTGELDTLLSQWMNKELAFVPKDVQSLIDQYKMFNCLVPRNVLSYFILLLTVAIRVGFINVPTPSRVIAVSQNDRTLLLLEYLTVIGEEKSYLYQALLDGSVDLSLLDKNFNAFAIESFLRGTEVGDLSSLIGIINTTSDKMGKRSNSRTNDSSC